MATIEGGCCGEIKKGSFCFSIFFVFCALSISSFFERSDNFAVMDTGFPLCCALTPFLCIRIKSTSIPRVSQKTLGIVTARFSFGVWG